jgi:hypothetical protein
MPFLAFWNLLSIGKSHLFLLYYTLSVVFARRGVRGCLRWLCVMSCGMYYMITIAVD